ncbi:MAG: 50S ribosomal protein L3 [Anaerolineae bacterium]|nr:50S ribosomal protein L3 [Anaerolineae bacterium]
MKGIIGKKVGMTQVFTAKGEAVPVTVIEAGPCWVTQVKTPKRDGYSAVQLGFHEVDPKKAQRKLTKAERGHLKDVRPLKVLREFRVEGETFEVGQKLDVGVFAEGEHVDITGTSKGKGFAGGMKRHNFRGGPKTHGQSDRQRSPGSIGSGTTPGRVLKGMRMAGHLGDEQVTVQNLEVVQVDPERNLLLVRGAVPGAKNGLLIIKQAVKGR